MSIGREVFCWGLKEADDAKIKEVLKSYYGIENLTADEMTLIKAGSVNKVVSNRANISWAYGGHIGGDVCGLFSL